MLAHNKDTLTDQPLTAEKELECCSYPFAILHMRVLFVTAAEHRFVFGRCRYYYQKCAEGLSGSLTVSVSVH
jgi:hypothetical protein